MEVLFLGFVLMMMMMMIMRGTAAGVLINCGANANATVNIDGRNWVSDIFSSPNPNFTLTSSSGGVGTAITTVNYPADSTLAPLFQTARFFTHSLNYTFSLTQGYYFLRLYFYPYFSFQNHNVSNQSSFTVMANGFKLVDKFNVFNEIQTKNSYLLALGMNATSLSSINEYFLDVDTDLLVVEFIPEKASFGFLNAIEIVPIEGTLFQDSVSKVGANGVSNNLNLSKRGIQTMYRLNVGGSSIAPKKDPDLWRMWESDSSYMFIADAGSGISNSSNITYASINDTLVAPLLVYETARTMFETEVLEKRFNMSWKFKVDSGFDYLIRLHFCELIFEKANQRLFRVFINNRTAVDNFDVFVRAGGMNKAYHHDFLDVLSTKTDTLWIQLGPDTAASASGTDAFLNGLEIFKLSRNGNLARIGPTKSDYPGSKNSKGQRFWVHIGVGVTSIAVFGVMFTLAFYLQRNCRNEGGVTSKKDVTGWRALSHHGVMVNNNKGSLKAGNQTLLGCMSSARVGKRFMLSEIRSATNNFDEKLVIGVGGFGKVYKGKIEEESTVAIKRAHPQSEQGLAEFETEIGMLSKLRHRHLVSMIGFCEEQNEMILVYEYMANGTLRSHLFGSDLPHLPWKQRLEVCIGAARGLHYLHTGADEGIIHRDIKTTNILLDDNFVAKMGDFGLSKRGPSVEHTHVSTAVKGSFGYLDPEYFRRQQLSEKSDVYSFGVVLFEVVCARAVVNPSLPREEVNLAEWAMRWQRERSLERIIDRRLIGSYCPESMKKYGEIAEKCIAEEGRKRPRMGEVLWHLEYVLQLQEAWSTSNNSFSSGQILVLP